jgi:hypothetical protein
MGPFGEIDRDPSRRELFKLGLTLLLGATAIGLVYAVGLHRVGAARAIWAAGVLAFAASFVRPLARPLYIGWMALGIALGSVVSPVVLLGLWSIVFVPAALAFRLVGRDFMKRKLDGGAASYWEPYSESDDPETYFQQF